MDSIHALLLTQTLQTKGTPGTGVLPAREANISSREDSVMLRIRVAEL
jgi:hypothetical protein